MDYYYDERKEMLIKGFVITGVVCALASPMVLAVTGALMEKNNKERIDKLKANYTPKNIVKFIEDNYDKDQITKFGVDSYVVEPKEEDIVINKNDWAEAKKLYEQYLSALEDYESGKTTEISYSIYDLKNNFYKYCNYEEFILATESESIYKQYKKASKNREVGVRMKEVCTPIAITETVLGAAATFICCIGQFDEPSLC